MLAAAGFNSEPSRRAEGCAPQLHVSTRCLDAAAGGISISRAYFPFRHSTSWRNEREPPHLLRRPDDSPVSSRLQRPAADREMALARSGAERLDDSLGPLPQQH